MNILRIIKRWTLRFLAFMITLFVVVWILLQFPAVQTFVVNKVTHELSQTLQTEVSVKKVNIRFFKRIVLENVLIKDQNRDTLIHVNDLETNIKIFSLRKNIIRFKNIALAGATIRLNRPSDDSKFNFDFLIDAFASDNGGEKKKEGWDFGLDNIRLQNVNFSLQDSLAGNAWSVHLKDFKTELESFDLKSKSIVVDEIKLSDSEVKGIVWKSQTYQQSDTINIALDHNLSLPYIGWDFKLENLKLRDNSFIFNDLQVEKKVDEINFSDLFLENINGELQKFYWSKNQLNGKIHELHFEEKSGFNLKNFSVNVLLDSSRIQTENLILQTPFSNLKNSTSITFSSWNDLKNHAEQLKFQSDFSAAKITKTDLAFFQSLLQKVEFLNFREFENILLDGKIEGTMNDFSTHDFRLKIGNRFDFLGNAKIKNISKTKQLHFDLEVNKLATSYLDLMKLTKNMALPEGVNQFGKMNLKTKVNGTLNDFFISKLEFQTSAKTALIASGQVQNATDYENLLLDLNIRNLQTQSEDIQGFATDKLPAQLDSLGVVKYAGEYQGNFKKYNLDGTFQTAIGDLTAKLLLDFNSDYSSAQYQGQIATESFHLGKLFGNQQDLGTIVLNAQLQGEGWTLDNLKAVTNTEIKQFTYKNYTYSNIKINGSFAQQNFIGTFESDDKNAQLDFEGKIDLSSEMPDYQFVMNVDTLNLKNINFLKNDLGIHSKMVVNLRGNQLDNLDGTIKIFDLKLAGDSLKFATDSILVKANQENFQNKKISIESDFLTANVSGNYQLEKFPELLQQFLETFISTEALEEAGLVKSAEQPDDQNFQMEILMFDSKPLTLFFIPELENLDTLHLKGKFNNSTQKIAIHGYIQQLNYNGLVADSIFLKTNGDPKGILQTVEFNHLNLDGQANFPFAKIENRLVKDTLDVNVKIEGEKGEQKLKIGGAISYFDDLIQLQLDEQVVLNDSIWEVGKNHSLLYKKDFFEINNLTLRKDHQLLVIESEKKNQPRRESIAPVNILFEKFQLAEIFRLLSPNESYLEGELNGDFLVKDLQTNPHYNVNLVVPSLKIDGQEAGRFTAVAYQSPNQSKITIGVDLLGKDDELKIEGKYDVQLREFNVFSNVKKLELSLLDPYLQKIISESQGVLSGEFELKGTPEAPELKGFLNLNKVSTQINFTKTRYNIAQQKIIFDERQFDLGILNLTDPQNRNAVVKGKILHRFFSAFEFDLNVQTDDFHFLNTSVEDNPLFYGQLFLKADLKVKGLLESPVVDIVATTLPKSDLTLSPFTESELLANEDYILFGNPEKLKQQDSIKTIYEAKNAFPFDVNLNLALTDDANFNFVVDPLSGDKLSCKGNSNLIINFKPSGTIEMYGIYTVASGQYYFSYGDFVKREFKIQPGGTVFFNGNPLNARFDLIAVRSTQTTTYELIANESTLSDTERDEAQKRQLVNVLLNIKGDLASPQIEFDIQLPESQGTVITSTIERKLDVLRSEPNELNKQVFGLLLLNSFIRSSSISSDLAGAGESAILSSVSKLFSNQLNQLADKFIKGVEVSIDFDSYRSDFENNEGNTTTEVGVGVSKRLFNDRLKIKATGNVDVNSTNNASTFSTLAGDFLLEYQLTKSGNYILKVFRKNHYDVLNESDNVKNGIGITIKKSFENKSKKTKKNK